MYRHICTHSCIHECTTCFHGNSSLQNQWQTYCLYMYTYRTGASSEGTCAFQKPWSIWSLSALGGCSAAFWFLLHFSLRNLYFLWHTDMNLFVFNTHVKIFLVFRHFEEGVSEFSVHYCHHCAVIQKHFIAISRWYRSNMCLCFVC